MGFERKITQLDGRQVEIVGDYNVQDGEIIKVENEGMPIRGEHGSYGDLLAEVSVKFPRSYTSDQLSAIK